MELRSSLAVLVLYLTLPWPCLLTIAFSPEPRITVSYRTLQGEIGYFRKADNLSTLLLDRTRDRLYVGGRDAIFALSVQNVEHEVKPKIRWQASQTTVTDCEKKGKRSDDCANFVKFLQFFNDTHIYTCGTYAFKPSCMFINAITFQEEKDRNKEISSGKSKCPFDPQLGYAALIADGDFYAGTTDNFLGTSSIISRSFGSRQILKSEYFATWLNEPNFVSAAFIEESHQSPIGDDDKIYFFFTEVAKEFTYFDKVVVSRIARVCKEDAGGKRILQNRWTTFLKAQLVCPDQDGSLFSVLRGTFVLQPNGPKAWKETVFYGVFSKQWSNDGRSAVCHYGIEEINRVFDGNYKQQTEQKQKCNEYDGQLPSPRPGQCITNKQRKEKYNSSMDLPDQTLSFVRDCPLMDQVVKQPNKIPLLIKSHVNYTTITVTRVHVSDEIVDVLFLGTDVGTLHKAVVMKNKDTWIVEELELFSPPVPIQSLLLVEENDTLFVGSPVAVLGVPTANCSRYRLCLDCLLARDPYCGWNLSAKSCQRITYKSNGELIQEFNSDDINSRCPRNAVAPQMKTVQDGGGFELHCATLSNLGTLTWKHNDHDVHSDNVYILQKDALVVLSAKEKHSGTYECFATESGIRWSIATYTVKVFAEPPDSAPVTQQAGTSAVVVLSLLFAACVCIICLLLWLLHKNGVLPLTGSQAQSGKSTKGNLLHCCSLNKSRLNGTHAPVIYSSHESVLDKLKAPGSSTTQALPNNYEDDPPQCQIDSSNKPFIVINSETTRDAESSI
uniref:semaphorin-4G isoform X2 n=1 Tax=Myxine glutinosa TaxID=7769 RepID=UPI00358E7586